MTIGGSVRGGAGDSSGLIEALGPVGNVAVAGDLVGGNLTGTVNLTRAGMIQAPRIAGLTIGGSLIAGTNTRLRNTFRDNGSVRVDDNIGTVLIKENMVGNLTNSAVVSARRIGRLTIGGDMVASTVAAENDIGSVLIQGNMVGIKAGDALAAPHPAVITARGQAAPVGATDLAIGRLTVRGRVELAVILAGVGPVGTSPNADAQVGPVVVGGDWVASSLAAGAGAGVNTFFGDADDAKMSGTGVKDDPAVTAKITSVTIGGAVLGTVGGADHFGIVAEQVGAVTVGGTAIPLTGGTDNVAVGITGDFAVREV